jgi:hypothetical protein
VIFLSTTNVANHLQMGLNSSKFRSPTLKELGYDFRYTYHCPQENCIRYIRDHNRTWFKASISSTVVNQQLIDNIRNLNLNIDITDYKKKIKKKKEYVANGFAL